MATMPLWTDGDVEVWDSLWLIINLKVLFPEILVI
jgi:hypothetical protein